MPVPDRRTAPGTRARAEGRRRGLIAGLSAGALAVAALGGCGGGGGAEVPVARERPLDQVLRIGATWQSLAEESGFRTPPSPIATFRAEVTSEVTLDPGGTAARERLRESGTWKLRDGRVFTCRAELEVQNATRYADRGGEPAVELSRPAATLERRCEPPGFPEARQALPATVGRFVLRGDRLLPYAPATERREYLPL